MGGSFDALMLREQQQAQQAPGRFSGTAVPNVNGPGPTSYTQPQNWARPAVSGRDLMVHRSALQAVAKSLLSLADMLQMSLSNCAAAAGPVAGAVGSWPEAQQLASAMTRAHTGVTQFTAQLRQAHSDMATRLTMSADRYDAAEQQITSYVHAALDPSATIIGSGGKEIPVQPGYGQNWTPQQRAAYYRIQRIENMPGNSGPNWTETFPITENASFSNGSSSGYTWQQVQSLLAATNPAAISTAGAAYGHLSQTLTQVASALVGHGTTLSENWGGATAVTAVSQVQQLYQTASDMQANTWSAQQSLGWYGPVLATFRSNLPQPASTHPADVKAANQAAQQRMAALNSHIETAYYQMPPAVNKNLPPPMAGTGGGTAGGGGAGAAGGGGSYPAGGSAASAGGSGVAGNGSHVVAGGQGTLASFGAPPGISPAGSVPPGQAPGSTQLAGVGSPGLGGPVPALPVSGGAGAVAPPGAGAGGGFGVLPPLPGTVSPGSVFAAAPGGSAAEALPGEALPGEVLPGQFLPGEVAAGELLPGQVIPGQVVPGEVAAGEFLPGQIFPGGLAPGGATAAGEFGTVPGAYGANAAAGDGLAGAGGDAAFGGQGRLGSFPVTGAGAGGAGQGEAGQGRQYWTAEDEATWGADVVPGGLGSGAGGDPGTGWMPGGSRAGRRPEQDRARMAWLGEDDDFWGAGGPAVPPVIGA
ncbi:MAG TPA: WXG100 family type VII secretion target [Streptosporangiaceae bacterium]|nr:WXG100 family type VII secretion target [Streptosporangiaceae bacterium]